MHCILDHEKHLSALQSICHGEVKANEPMAWHTSFRIGGPAQFWAEPRDKATFLALLSYCHGAGVPFFVIGNGTNLLVRDGGICGLVISTKHALAFWTIGVDKLVQAGAGAALPRLARQASEAGLTGLEFAAGIPGTVGGGLATNCGAHDRCLGEFVESVEFWNDGGLSTVPSSRLEFGNRKSNAKKFGVALGAALRLEAGDAKESASRIQIWLSKRKASQPLDEPSAGCVFKNPSGQSAGQIIDALGLKGTRVSGAMVSPVHANFIVNTGGATAADVLELVERIKKRVQSETGVCLEEEIEVVGEDR